MSTSNNNSTPYPSNADGAQQARLPGGSTTGTSSSSLGEGENEDRRVMHTIVSLDEEDTFVNDKNTKNKDNQKRNSVKDINPVSNIISHDKSFKLSKDHIALAIQRAARDSRMSGGNGDDNTAAGNLNEVLLYRALCSAGAWAYGVLAAEVWIFDKEEGVLRRPPGGFWRDMVLEGESTALAQLETSDSQPLSPGEGLPGALWAEADAPLLSQIRHKKKNRGFFFNNRSSQRGGLDEEDGGLNDNDNDNEDEDDPFNFHRKVVWRNIKALAADPDQPPNEHLQILAQTNNLELAAGVSFYVRGTKGIVIYMTRCSSDSQKLQHPDNESYLIGAADTIGAEAALGEVRALAIRNRIQDRHETLARARRKIKLAMYLYHQKKIHGEHVEIPPYYPSDSELNENNNTSYNPDNDFSADIGDHASSSSGIVTYMSIKSRHISEWTTSFIGRQINKAMGSPSDVNPPPFAPIQQCLVALFGSLVTLMAVGRINMWLQLVSEKELVIIMGPIAAQTALQYGLTAAPSAQPRCAIYGQILSITIAMCISYIPTLGVFASWLRPAIATSLAITVMVALGMCHPPGAATAYLFAAGKNSWAHLGILLIAYTISITLSVIINNWFDQRQYPIYWKWTYGTPIHYYSQRTKQKMFGFKSKEDEEAEMKEKDIEKGK